MSQSCFINNSSRPFCLKSHFANIISYSTIINSNSSNNNTINNNIINSITSTINNRSVRHTSLMLLWVNSNKIFYTRL